MAANILIIEDEEKIARFVRRGDGVSNSAKDGRARNAKRGAQNDIIFMNDFATDSVAFCSRFHPCV